MASKQKVDDQAFLLESLRTKVAALLILQQGKDPQTRQACYSPKTIVQQVVVNHLPIPPILALVGSFELASVSQAQLQALYEVRLQRFPA
jgi:hypothetical protein